METVEPTVSITLKLALRAVELLYKHAKHSRRTTGAIASDAMQWFRECGRVVVKGRTHAGLFGIHIDYVLDRRPDAELARGYELLIICRERPVGRVKECDHGDGNNLRVSSEQQREERTVVSQTAWPIKFAKKHDLEMHA